MLRRIPKPVGGHTHFVTILASVKGDWFTDEKVCRELLELFEACRAKSQLKCLGYVLMPDHFHALIYQMGKGAFVPLLLETFKRQSQEKFRPKGFPQKPLWKNMVGDNLVVGAEEIRLKLLEIHENPTRAELCEKIEDYAWSSARDYQGLGTGPITLTRTDADLTVATDENTQKLQTLRTHFQRIFSYDSWANKEALAALKAMPNPPEKAVELLGHILISQQFVYNLLTGQSNANLQDRDGPSLQECEDLVETLGRAWHDYMRDLSSKTVQGFINFKNSRGESDRQAVTDLLTHAAMHSHYHRAQIATNTRIAGGEPARTDYIVYARKIPQK